MSRGSAALWSNIYVTTICVIIWEPGTTSHPHLLGGGGRWGRNVTKTVLGEHFELRPRALHASDGGERGRNRSQTQQCGACEPAEEINLMGRKNKKKNWKKKKMRTWAVLRRSLLTGKLWIKEMIPGRRRMATLANGLLATEEQKTQRDSCCFFIIWKHARTWSFVRLN